MKIQLDLSKHCIETELKRLHNQSISLYFKTKGMDEELDKKVGHIGRALENLDFPSLRSRFPDLAGGSTKSILLSIEEDGTNLISIDSEEIVSF